MATKVESELKLSERAVCERLAARKLSTVDAVAADVGIAPSTVVAVLARLMKKGRIFRREMSSGGRGRPSYRYGVCLAGPQVAMHWDGSQLAGAIFEDDATTLAMQTVNVRDIKSQLEASIIAQELFVSLATQVGRARQSFRSLALSLNVVPGTEGSLRSSVLPWVDKRVARVFSQCTGLKTRLVYHPGLEAEYQLMGTAAPQAMAYLHVADGVSGRFTTFGKPYAGQSSWAGQLGHITIDPNGPRCGCGRRGCLETLCNGPAIVRAARSAVRAPGSPRWLEDITVLRSPAIVIDAIWSRWQQGDRHALAIMDAPLERLAAAMGVLFNLLDPEQLVAGGYVLQGRDKWLDELRKRSRAYVLYGNERELPIVSARAQLQDILRSIALSPDVED